MKTYLIDKLEDLELPAQDLVTQLREQPVACFYGEMGAGKTTFIKLLCEKMGVEDVTSSPTFSIVNEYIKGDGDSLYHFDFYRIKNLEEAQDVGVEEYLYSGDICLIEWPEMINALIPDEHLEINIKLVDGNKRSLTINTHR
jgi:tRNA threonylcarbamoyladenosine biosynthesis protein TsaE